MGRRTAIPIIVLAVVLVVTGVALVQPQDAAASRFCGTFREPGLLTKIQVYANRYVGCDQAIRIMKRRLKGNTPSGWHCIGPQTGYAKCTKGRKRVVAHF
jgi:hypothetical protein